MNDLDSFDSLSVIVRDALISDAERAPRLPEDWPGLDRMTLAPIEPRHSRYPSYVMAAAAAVALVVVLAGLARSDDDTAPTANRSWIPAGTEFALTDLGPATEVLDGPVVSSLTRQVAVEGHPPLVVETSLMYLGNATAVEQRCLSGACRPEWNTSTWSTAITSSIDNHEADFNLWLVEGLPAGTAYVTYVDGDKRLWQRPIAGVAAFPDVAGTDEQVTAYDDVGNQIAQFGEAHRQAEQFTGTPPLLADISTLEFQQLGELTRETLATCLRGHGGTIGAGDVATFPEDVDQISVWDDCATSVRHDVAESVSAIGARYYDPVTEYPTNPDPAVNTSAVANPPDAASTTQTEG